MTSFSKSSVDQPQVGNYLQKLHLTSYGQNGKTINREVSTHGSSYDVASSQLGTLDEIPSLSSLNYWSCLMTEDEHSIAYCGLYCADCPMHKKAIIIVLDKTRIVCYCLG